MRKYDAFRLTALLLTTDRRTFITCTLCGWHDVDVFPTDAELTAVLDRHLAVVHGR